MFKPPANIDDFSKSNGKEDALKQAWHDRMAGIVDRITNTKYDDGSPFYPRFYNPLNVAAGEQVIPKSISWDGFPLIIENWLNLDDNSSKDQYDQGFRSADIPREVAYVYRKYMRNGQVLDEGYELLDFDPSQGVALFRMINGRPQLSDPFSLKERIQDEYLEWFVKQDNTGRVTDITFTAEGPEYWETIAKEDPELLTKLYQDYVDDTIDKDDLYWQFDIVCPVIEVDVDSGQASFVNVTGVFLKGDYNKYNKWNTTKGIMHLIQRNNSLGAEVRLAADATRRYGIKPDLNANPTRFELVACGVPAGINRNSDPTITEEVNKLALSDLKVSISNPIGLYIGDIQVNGILDPDDNPVARDDILTIERGDEDPFAPKILRFKLSMPGNRTEGLEQYTLNGFNLKYGGPVAKETSIVIYGEGIADTSENPLQPCTGKPCYHPDKPNFIQVTRINNPCDDIDWANMKPPFTVAEFIDSSNVEASLIDTSGALEDAVSQPRMER